MALRAGTLTSAIAVTGLLSFIFAIVAENKKPASGLATKQGDLTICVYPTDPYVPLGVLSAILLACSSVFGVLSIFFAYDDKPVPWLALARSRLLVAFGIMSSILFAVAEGLILWGIITENAHHRHQNTASMDCPTAKTGLIGGAAFLALDTMLFWLVTQMLTMNARADYLEIDDEDEKGPYTYAPEFAGVSEQPGAKA